MRPALLLAIVACCSCVAAATMPVEGETRPDAGAATDGGAQPDAGAGPDAGAPADAGLSLDGGAVADAGAALDGGPALDAGAGLDGGAAPDAGPAPDAGATSDAGVTPDAGPPVDDGGAVYQPGDGGSACRGVEPAGPPSSPPFELAIEGEPIAFDLAGNLAVRTDAGIVLYAIDGGAATLLSALPLSPRATLLPRAAGFVAVTASAGAPLLVQRVLTDGTVPSASQAASPSAVLAHDPAGGAALFATDTDAGTWTESVQAVADDGTLSAPAILRQGPSDGGITYASAGLSDDGALLVTTTPEQCQPYDCHLRWYSTSGAPLSACSAGRDPCGAFVGFGGLTGALGGVVYETSQAYPPSSFIRFASGATSPDSTNVSFMDERSWVALPNRKGYAWWGPWCGYMWCFGDTQTLHFSPRSGNASCASLRLSATDTPLLLRPDGSVLTRQGARLRLWPRVLPQ